MLYGDYTIKYMPRKNPERKYMKKTDGRKGNGAKRGDALVRKTMATPANINKAKKNRSKILATNACLLYTSPSPRDRTRSRMPSSA